MRVHLRGAVIALGLLCFLTAAPALPDPAPAAANIAAARATWLELRTPSFVTLTDAGERKGREIALSFERFREALGLLWPSGVPAPPVPTHIVVFDSNRSFEPYKVGQGDRREYLAGLFQGGPAADYVLLNGHPARGSALPAVYHEYLHAVLRAGYARLPLWLNEGLAELYSTFEVERGEVQVGKPVAAHVQVLRERSFLPLPQLFAITETSPEYQEGERVGTFYAESWLLVHYLMMGDADRLERSRAFLKGLGRGEEPEPAFRAAFGYGFDKLEKELRGYVNAPTFSYRRLPEAQLGPAPAVTLRPLQAAEALYHLGSVLALRSGEPDAAARQHLHAAADAGVPDAWAMLGFMDDLAGREESAAALYKKAHDGGASRPESLYLIARGRLATFDAPGAREARELLQRALAADPGYAEAQALLGKTYLATDDDPAPGIAAVTAAAERLPARADVAYDLAMLELKAGHVDRATALVDEALVPLGDARATAAARQALAVARANAKVDAANAAGEAGDAALAVTTLEEALAEATDPEVRAALEAHLRAAEEHKVRQSQIDRFNAAADQANAGKRREAREALRALRREVTDLKLLDTIDAALASLDKALGKG